MSFPPGFLSSCFLVLATDSLDCPRSEETDLVRGEGDLVVGAESSSSSCLALRAGLYKDQTGL